MYYNLLTHQTKIYLTEFHKISSRSTTLDGETVVNNIGDIYSTFTEEGLVINALGAVLVGLAILVPAILKCDAFRKGLPREGRHEDDFESH